MAKDKINKKAAATSTETSTNSTKNLQQSAAGSAILQDARFQHLVSDPRFKSISKVQRKVKIDKRFQGMFNDDKFKVKYTVDKYGRRVNKSNADDLRKYYEIDSDSAEDDNADDDEHEEKERRKEEKAISRESDESGESSGSDVGEPGENDELVGDGEEVPKSLRERLLDPQIDYARGEGRLVTDSSSDDESTDDENDPEMLIDHVWGELHVDAETTDESTNRLAVCNMDWDRIRAVDLMMLFSSFLPRGGSILSVKIYPSEFGKERLAEEEVHGPTELVGLGKQVKEKSQKNNGSDDESEASDSEEELVQEQDSDAGEGDDYHMEKLRQYQLNRLRYYYAVVVCDSVATADKIYKECDGIEYESSATKVDLRFIQDGTSFDEDEPTDVCTELPETNSYTPRQFTTTALQQAKVDLTWDETAVERRELGDRLASGKLDEVSDKDIRKIVAYSSEEDDEETDDNDGNENEKVEEAAVSNKEEQSDAKLVKKHKKTKEKREDVINKYKALLEEINEKERKEKNNKYEMEFSWEINDTKEEKDDKDIDPKSKPQPELTPIEKVLQKRSEKNKKRKEERKKKKLQSLGIDPAEQNSDDDSDGVPDGVDMNDPYFAEEFASGDFAEPKAKQAEKAKRQKKAQVSKEEQEEDERRAKELQLLLDDDDAEDQEKQHFSLEKILKAEQETKSKRKRRKQLKKSKAALGEESKELVDNFQVNINDDRFKAVYTSHLFNIDPTDSHFKKTKAMEQIIQEKLKRRHGSESGNETHNADMESESKKPKKQLENTLLIKSLKRKIQMKQQQKF